MAARALDQDLSDALHENADEGCDVAPFPWAQLLIVLLIQCSGSMAQFALLPFINQFVRETGVTGDETRTGYFAGIMVRTWSLHVPFYILR
jgi:hypothetical protein